MPRRSPRTLNVPQPDGQGHASQGTAQVVTPAPANGASAFFSSESSDGSLVSAAAREAARLRPGGKPSRKNITLEAFSGLITTGTFDAGVRRWWRKFQDQLADAQILDGHRWNDLQCRSIFAASLSGDAADWYSEVRATVPNLTLEVAGRMLVDRFKSKLPEQELLRRIMDEPKIRQETYQQYSQRLLNMADSLPGGLAVDSNARCAMHTFVRLAYYKYSDELKSFLGRLAPESSAVIKLQRLVDHLSYMAESDGQLPAKTDAQGTGRHEHDAKRRKSSTGYRAQNPEKSMAVIVEHKRKPPQRSQGNGRQDQRGKAGDKSPSTAGPSTECYNCHEYGHFAADCPQKQGRNVTAAKLRGSAAAALADASA